MAEKIMLPLTEELADTLHAGDEVLVSGVIYTSRDAGHKRMCEALARGEELPFDPTDATIYYVGPTPAAPGAVIGSAGPTTSGRMDAYAPTMMSVGARGMIGKGARLPEVVEAMKKYHGVYFGAIGGAGALLAKSIKQCELIAYEDLGAEALRKLYVEDMPLVVIIDSQGNNLYEIGREAYLNSKKKRCAVLTVSFGTGFADTRAKTIDRIEAAVSAAMPECHHYRAWTSPRIRRRLAEKEHIFIPGAAEALEQIKKDGADRLVVQPTFILNGVEGEKLQALLKEYEADFEEIVLGRPLLAAEEVLDDVVRAAAERYPLEEDEALIFMGHGTYHEANEAYCRLDKRIKELGYANDYVATVEPGLDIQSVMEKLKEKGIKTVHLAPFMIVAGDHARNDMAGEDEASWKSQLEANGFRTICHLNGLGEIPGIRMIIAEEAKRVYNG